MGKMNVSKPLVIFTVLFVFLVNIPPCHTVAVLLDRNDLRFATGDGQFTFKEYTFKGRDFQQCLARFADYKDSVRQGIGKYSYGDTTLYRLNRKNLFKFWNWGEYLFKDKFSLPYKDWTDIEQKRGRISYHGQYQDF